VHDMQVACSLSTSYFMCVHVYTALNRPQPQVTAKVCADTNHMLTIMQFDDVSLSYVIYVRAELNESW
jgi:hypothetical protein